MIVFLVVLVGAVRRHRLLSLKSGEGFSFVTQENKMRKRIVAVGLVLASSLGWTAPVPFIAVPAEWGEPRYESYEDPERGFDEWTYVRPGATLIVLRSECPECNPLGSRHVDSTNQGSSGGALLVVHPGGPATFTVGRSDKNVSSAAFRMIAAEQSYEIWLIVNDKTPSEEGFLWQYQLMRLAADFRPPAASLANPVLDTATQVQ